MKVKCVRACYWGKRFWEVGETTEGDWDKAPDHFVEVRTRTVQVTEEVEVDDVDAPDAPEVEDVGPTEEDLFG